MSEHTPTDTAKQAIHYLLDRIQNDPRLAWYMMDTESYSRLIDAASELSGLDRYAVQRHYMPESTEDPYEKGKRDLLDEAGTDPDSVLAKIIDEAEGTIAATQEDQEFVIHPREQTSIEAIFAEIDDDLVTNRAGRCIFQPHRYNGRHEIRLLISR